MIACREGSRSGSALCPRVFKVGLLAIFLVAVSLISFLAMPTIIVNAVRAKLPITSPSSMLFAAWRSPASQHITIMRRYRVFNCTNAEEVVRSGVIPNFDEVGPFVFTEDRSKPFNSIQWFTDGTVGYHYESRMSFVPEESIDARTGRQLSLGDRFTIPNGPLFGAAYRLSRMNNSIPIKQVVCDVIQPWNDVGIIGIFSIHNATEILWGYKDKLWEITKIGVLLLDPKYYQPITFRTEWNGSSIVPGTISPNFGQECPMWDDINQCNTTMNRLTTEYIGAPWFGGEGLDRIGQMKTWAGQEKLSWWGADGVCQTVQGTEGTLFKPGLAVGDTPWIFVDVLYRALKGLVIDGPEVRGIPTHRVIIHPDTLAVSAENACYDQSIRGVWNLTAALFGPVYGTKPHFFDVDMKRINITINGKRVEEVQAAVTDESQFDVEPITGITMHACARFQVNLHIHPYHPYGCEKPMARTSKLPDTLAPLFYIEREVTINQEKADDIKRDILVPLLAVKISGCVAAALAGVCLLIAIRTLFQMRCIPCIPPTPPLLNCDSERPTDANSSMATHSISHTSKVSELGWQP
jgi:hypothetical protein